MYGEKDARITAAVPDVEKAMKAAGKAYQYTVYPGTGNGFLRTRDVPERADKAISDILTFFGEKMGK